MRTGRLSSFHAWRLSTLLPITMKMMSESSLQMPSHGCTSRNYLI
ncbi:hypothetical protein GYH30_006813 [Glycine max]|nr:hypothetical protein GYH30_006813 [Glycine max]